MSVAADMAPLLQTTTWHLGLASAQLWTVSVQHEKASGQSAVSFCSTDTGGNPSTSGANAVTSSGKAKEQADAESLEDREFRQAVQARRKSPLDTSSSYRSTASSDDSSDPDNTAHSPADKAKWDSKKKTGRQLQQHFSRLVKLQPHCFFCFTASICTG